MNSNGQKFSPVESGLLPTSHGLYPWGVFPFVARNAVGEVVQNIQGPVPMIALSAITAMSAVCQPLIVVKLPTGQTVAASINTATVAESGERKTATDKVMMGPLYTADAVRMRKFEDEAADHQASVLMWEAKLTAIRRKITAVEMKAGNPKNEKGEGNFDVDGDDVIELTNASRDDATDDDMENLRAGLIEHMKMRPKRQKLRRTIRQEITPRAMMEALQGDGESIVLNSEEGDMLLSSGAMSSMGLLNKLWDGPEILAFDRSQHDSIVVRNPHASVSFMVQSAVLGQFLDRRGKAMRGSGQWARYLIAWPESMQGFRFVPYSDPIWAALPSFHARMNELVAEYDRQIESGKVQPEVLEFDDDARVGYVNLQNWIEPMLRPMHYLNDIKDFASKASEMVGRLAALFHKFSRQDGKITLDTFNRSWSIVEWHLLEFKRIFGEKPKPPQEQVDAQVLESWFWEVYCKSGCCHPIRKNYVRQYGPNCLRAKNRLNAALFEMVRSNKLFLGVAGKTDLVHPNPGYWTLQPAQFQQYNYTAPALYQPRI